MTSPTGVVTFPGSAVCSRLGTGVHFLLQRLPVIACLRLQLFPSFPSAEAGRDSNLAGMVDSKTRKADVDSLAVLLTQGLRSQDKAILDK
jgi:hypothetical protein